MKPTVLTKKIILEALCADEVTTPAKPKTELEARENYIINVYDADGDCVDAFPVKSVKKAKKYLQQPENLGKTITVLKEVGCYTTNIPVVNVK